MSNTGFENFDSTVQETNQLLGKIEKEFGWPEDRRTQSYSLLRAVLHAVRDNLPTNEAVHFAEQLPMLVKGFYYEGWVPSDTPKDMDREEFEQTIRQDYQLSSDEDFEDLISKTFNIVMKSISDGEAEQVKGNLNEGIRELLG